MKIIQVGSIHCQICKMMQRLLGDRVEYVMVEEHPEAVEGSAYQEFPIYRVLEGDKLTDLCAGAMPVRVFEEKAAAYADSRH